MRCPASSRVVGQRVWAQIKRHRQLSPPARAEQRPRSTTGMETVGMPSAPVVGRFTRRPASTVTGHRAQVPCAARRQESSTGGDLYHTQPSRCKVQGTAVARLLSRRRSGCRYSASVAVADQRKGHFSSKTVEVERSPGQRQPRPVVSSRSGGRPRSAAESFPAPQQALNKVGQMDAGGPPSELFAH